MTQQTAALIAPLCIAVPLGAAAVLMPLTKAAPKWLGPAVATIVSAAVAAAAWALAGYGSTHAPLIVWLGGWTPHNGMAVGISLAVEAMNAGLASFIALLVFAASVYTWRGFDSVGTLFHALLLAFLGAMCGFALTGDIFNMFVWFELMTAAAIALTAHKIEESIAIEGAINLAVTNTIAGFIVLLGIALLYGRTGALNMQQIGIELAHGRPDALIVTALALIVCGYFVKGSVFPFHFWLDDAHAVAPTPVCVLFSGIMVQLALYAVARVFWSSFAPVFRGHITQLQGLFVTAGVVTAIVGSLMAFAQRHLKRLLAFSTVSHSGMFVAAFAMFNAAGIAAAALFIAAHGLVKSALFVCAGNYLNRFESLDEQTLAGRGKDAPLNSALYLLGGAALAALPPFGLSAAKMWLDGVLADARWVWVAVIMAIVSAIDGAAVLRSGLHITFGIGKAQDTGFSPRTETTECEEQRLERTPWSDLAIAIVLLGAALWLGLSTPMVHNVAAAAAAFVQHRSAVRPLHQSIEDLGINAAVCMVAMLIAFAALYRERLWRYLGVAANVPIAALRMLHTGVYTDYVFYAIGGIAAFSAWLLIAVR